MRDSELVFAAFLLLAALVTGLATLFGRWYISTPMVFVFAGIRLGSQATGVPGNGNPSRMDHGDME